MPQAPTKHFATVEYDERAILTFPVGLPAFEGLTRFLLIEHPSVAPLAFLQSLEDRGVCFPTLPVLAADAGYELSLSSDDLETLGFTASGQVPGENALGCFVIVSVSATGAATANLAAPVVVNLASRLAVQAVRPDAKYSYQHPVAPDKEGVCS